MNATRQLALLTASASVGAIVTTLYGQRVANRHHRAVVALTRAVWTRPLEVPEDHRPRLVLVSERR